MGAGRCRNIVQPDKENKWGMSSLVLMDLWYPPHQLFRDIISIKFEEGTCSKEESMPVAVLFPASSSEQEGVSYMCLHV